MGKCEWKPAFPRGEVCFLIVSLPLCTPLYCQIPPEKAPCLPLRRQENTQANGQRAVQLHHTPKPAVPFLTPPKPLAA